MGFRLGNAKSDICKCLSMPLTFFSAATNWIDLGFFLRRVLSCVGINSSRLLCNTLLGSVLQN